MKCREFRRTLNYLMLGISLLFEIFYVMALHMAFAVVKLRPRVKDNKVSSLICQIFFLKQAVLMMLSSKVRNLTAVAIVVFIHCVCA